MKNYDTVADACTYVVRALCLDLIGGRDDGRLIFNYGRRPFGEAVIKELMLRTAHRDISEYSAVDHVVHYYPDRIIRAYLGKENARNVIGRNTSLETLWADRVMMAALATVRWDEIEGELALMRMGVETGM